MRNYHVPLVLMRDDEVLFLGEFAWNNINEREKKEATKYNQRIEAFRKLTVHPRSDYKVSDRLEYNSAVCSVSSVC